MTDTWLDSLPEDMRSNPTLSKFKDSEGLAKSYIELERMQSRSITMPGEHATDEDWDKYYTKAQEGGHLTVHPDHATDEHKSAFWKSLGVPEDGNGYSTAEGFDGLPKEWVDNLRNVAVAAGWTNKQYQATLAEFAKENATQAEANETAMNDDKGIVSGKWGMAEEQKKSAIAALINEFQDPGHPLGELNASAYLMLDNIVKKFSGKGPQAFKQPVSGNQQYTPGELDEMIDKVTTDMEDNGRQMGKERYNALQAKRLRYIGMRGSSN